MDRGGVGNADRRTPEFLEMLPYVDLEESASHHKSQIHTCCESINIDIYIKFILPHMPRPPAPPPAPPLFLLPHAVEVNPPRISTFFWRAGMFQPAAL